MQISKIILSAFIMSATIAMDEPTPAPSEELQPGAKDPMNQMNFVMKLSSLPERDTIKRSSLPERDPAFVVPKGDHKNKKAPKWISLRTEESEYLRLTTTGKQRLLVEDFDPNEMLNTSSGLALRRNLVDAWKQVSARRIVIYEQSQSTPYSVLVEANSRFFTGRGEHLLTYSSLTPKNPEKLWQTCYRAWWEKYPFLNKKLPQNPLTTWSLEGTFDVVVDDGDHLWGKNLPNRATTLDLTGKSRLALTEDDGSIILQQEQGATTVLHCKRGTFGLLIYLYGHNQPMRPHDPNYASQSHYQVALKSNGTSLTIEQRIFLPALASISSQHPRLREGLVIPDPAGIRSYDPTQKVVIGGQFGLHVEKVGTKFNVNDHLASRSAYGSPAEFVGAKIPDSLTGIYPVIGTWGYFCDVETIANAVASSFGPTPKGVSFYFQDKKEQWMVWATGEKFYEVTSTSQKIYQNADFSTLHIVAQDINNFLETARKSDKFLPYLPELRQE